jgi:hypothetical protein
VSYSNVEALRLIAHQLHRVDDPALASAIAQVALLSVVTPDPALRGPALAVARDMLVRILPAQDGSGA